MTISIALAALAAAQIAPGEPLKLMQGAPPAARAAPVSAPQAAQTVQAPWQARINPAPTTPAAAAINPPSAPAIQAPNMPALASSSGPILWRTIQSGMSVAELRALYPQGSNVHYKIDRTILSEVPIIEGCNAKVNIMHQAGVVQEIVMRGEGAIAGRCSLKLITALSGKYGESLEKDKVQGSLFARQGKNYIWSRDGVTLLFKRYTSGPLGGGGLFAASWELRYSANAANIDL